MKHEQFALFESQSLPPQSMPAGFRYAPDLIDADEEALFVHGQIIHHFPYLGIGDRTTLNTLFESTQALFITTFGESPASAGAATFSEPSLCNVGGLSRGVGCVNSRPTLDSSSLELYTAN